MKKVLFVICVFGFAVILNASRCSRSGEEDSEFSGEMDDFESQSIDVLPSLDSPFDEGENAVPEGEDTDNY